MASDEPATSTNRPLSHNLARAFLCLAFAAAGALLLNETMIYSPDSVNYLAWARSLSTFSGFRVDLGPEPVRYVANAPLYPVLLAPIAAFFPWSILAAKITTLAFGVLMVVSAHAFLGGRLSASAALAATTLFAIHPLSLVYSTQILSDVPFLACVILGFSVCAGILTAERPSTKATVILAVLTCAAVLLREVGIAFAAAVGIALFARRKSTTLLWLILALIVTYGLWYLRNEVYIAGREQPDLRNSRLFFEQVLTPSEGSLAGEFLARILAAIRFYAPFFGRLVFAPVSVVITYCFDSSPDPALSAARSALSFLELPVQALTVGLFIWGGFTALRKSHLQTLILAFMAAYVTLILLYPINDVRFLFPLLFVASWWICAGASDLVRRIPRGSQVPARILAVVVVVAVLVPLGLWLKNVGSLNAYYRSDPVACRTMLRTNDPSPNQLLLDTHPVAEWIAGHSPSSASVVSAHKDAGIWLGGRPILRLNPLLAPEDFENFLRDYDVTFVISSLLGHEIPDFEAQMVMGKRFRYTQVYAAGDFAVFTVAPRERAGEPTFILSRVAGNEHHVSFLRGLLSLNAGATEAAKTIFEGLTGVPALEAYATYYLALTEEAAHHLDEAEALLRKFRSMPQAAAYLFQARYHEDVIGLLREAEGSLPPEDRALLYHTISLSYWILGLHHQAAEMMNRALDSNPQLFIGHLFRGLYALSDGDTVRAKASLTEAIHVRPDDPLAPSLVDILSLLDSLPGTTDRSRIEIGIGRDYVAMGLIEMGIDQARKALLYDTMNADALTMLVELYEKKGRPVPELRALRKLLEITPHNPALQEKLHILAG